MIKRVLSIYLLGLIIGFFSTTAFAATTTYTSYSTWLANIGGSPTFLVDFNNFTQDTSITSPLDVGPFIVHSIGGIGVDVPPYINSDSVYGDGTPNLSIFVQGNSEGGSKFATMSFKSPIYSWFGDFWAAGNSGYPLEVSLISGSNTMNLVIGGTGTGKNSFGFITDLPITELVLHNAINDGFNLDNIAGKSSVPIPSAIWLLGSSLLGLIGIRKRMQS
jgi:hypothetical protein